MQVNVSKSGYKLVQWYYGKKLEIPNSWQVSTLEKECKQIQDADHKVPTRTKIGVPFLTINNVVENEIIDFTNTPLVSEQDYLDFIKKVRPEKGDVLYSRVATIGIARLIEETRKFVVTSNVVVIKTKDTIESKFLVYLLNYTLIKNRVLSLTPGSAYSFLSLAEIRKIPVILPSIKEQQRIVSILSNVDSLIQQTQKKIELDKKLKKGLMQKLLTRGIGHTRFKKVKWLFGKEIEIPEIWIRTTVSEIFQLKTGGTPSRTNPDFFTGNVPWVTSTDLNRGIITTTLESISQQAIENARLKIFSKGTFVIATYGLEAAGTRGKCGILNIDATINQACMAFLPSEKFHPLFLFYFYLEYGERIAFNYAQGTKQQNLYPDTVKKIPIVIPPLPEQQKIASILSNVDSQIQKHQEYKSHLETLKKGLTQKLLTGQIRVKI